jgi:hypothetical protein
MEYIISEEQLYQLEHGYKLKTLAKEIRSNKLPDKTKCGCLCDCCMVTDCSRNSGRGYPVVKG